MKKTLLALAVLTAAGSVNAANVLDADGVKMDLTGAAEIQLINKYDTLTQDKDLYVRIDDGDLAFKTTVEVSDDLSAIGVIAFKFEDGNTTNDDLYVGLSYVAGTTTIGRQVTVVDDAGIGEDYELGTEGTDFLVDSGDEVIKHKFEGDNFWVAASYGTDGDGEEAAGSKLPVAVDFGAGVTFADVTISGFYQSVDDQSTSTNGVRDSKAYNFEVTYAVDAFSLAGSYGSYETELSVGGSKTEFDVIMLAGTYSLSEMTTLAGGVNFGDYNTSGVDDAKNYYANVTHKLHSNVKVYAELGYADTASIDGEVAYVAGMEVKF